jgi:hypothetical protein
MIPFSLPPLPSVVAPIASACMKPGRTSRPSDSAHRSARIVGDWKIRRGYQNEYFEHPRNCVRRASGLVLTRDPEVDRVGGAVRLVVLGKTEAA